MPDQAVSSSQQSSRRVHQRGSVSVMVLAWCAITAISVIAVAHTGERLATHQYLQHGADAVALAWVSRGSDVAQALAEIYNVKITQADTSDGRVRVWVRRGDHIASATAQYTQ